MMFTVRFWLIVFIFIDLLLAWWYAKCRDICKVIIFCTVALGDMMSLYM
jgi:hypothetical protein